jgi:hypothetical protein
LDIQTANQDRTRPTKKDVHAGTRSPFALVPEDKMAAFTFNFVLDDDDNNNIDDDDDEKLAAARTIADGKFPADSEESCCVVASPPDSASASCGGRNDTTSARPFHWVENLPLLLEDRSQEELIYKEIPIVSSSIKKTAVAATRTTTTTEESSVLRVVDLHFSSYKKPTGGGGGDDADNADIIESSSPALHHINQKRTSDSSTADIVTGVYEGGAKVWECSLDLVDYLAVEMDNEMAEKNANSSSNDNNSDDIGWPAKVWEIGCGHGLPGCYLLHRWIVGRQRQRRSSSDDPTTSSCWSITFSDYNEEVVLDATLSNLVLNAHIGMPPAAAAVNSSSDNDIDESRVENTSRIIQVDDVARHIRLGAGDWMDQSARMMVDTIGRPETFDLILAAETIYTEQSCREMVTLLRRHLEPDRGVALIATKRYYFGVGGGVDCFRSYAAAATTAPTTTTTALSVESVHVIDHGSGNIREILKVTIA